jgi:peptidoglycan/LPS O-acetylase OafA/YrhL
MEAGNSRRIDEIEVLRAIAIMMVFIEHIPINLFFWRSQLGDVLAADWNGSAGVDLFFAISGFVIARGLLPRLQDCPAGAPYARTTLTFLLHRFWRLQPSAWLWVAVPLIVGLFFNRSGALHTPHANLAAGLTALLGISNFRFAAIFGSQDGGLSFAYWSLSLEEQFYILLPLLALLLRARLAWAMLALLAWQFLMPPDPLWYATRPGALAAGVLLAIWRESGSYAIAAPAFLRHGPIVRAAFVCGIVAALGALESNLPRPLMTIPYGMVALLSALAVYAASFDCGYILPAGLLRDMLVWIGNRSYAIYLIHIPAFAFTRELYMWVRPPGLFHSTQEATHYVVVALFLTLALSDLNYRFVETPLRRYGRAIVLS